MMVVTCGFLLYRRNRELHALSIIGLNCQDKKKKKIYTISSLRQAANWQTMSGKQSIIKPARTFSGNFAFIPSKQLILSIFVHHVVEAGFAFFLLLFLPSFFPFSIRHFVICVGVSKWISSFVKSFTNIPPSFQRFLPFVILYSRW